MNVLVACEESQRVCSAFRAKGHNAFSCDIRPCSGGHHEWHIQGDVLKNIEGGCFLTSDWKQHYVEKWDMMIAFPPCTYLTNCATRAFSLRVTPAEKVVERWDNRAQGAIFFMRIALANIEKIVVENPIGYMNKHFRKPDQIIQPYYFADSENDIENYQVKTTCLWLKGVKPLQRTNNLPKPKPVHVRTYSDGSYKNVYFEEAHGTIAGVKNGENDSVARSKTFPNVARAMAEQWG